MNHVSMFTILSYKLQPGPACTVLQAGQLEPQFGVVVRSYTTLLKLRARQSSIASPDQYSKRQNKRRGPRLSWFSSHSQHESSTATGKVQGAVRRSLSPDVQALTEPWPQIHYCIPHVYKSSRSAATLRDELSIGDTLSTFWT